MITLSSLSNTHRPKDKVQRIGRGMGSKRGRSCCRGIRGDKSRRGYKRRFGQEGGQLPLYRKLPCRGFVNGKFKSHAACISLEMIEQLFNDGDVVSFETVRERGYAPRKYNAMSGLKILADGELKKKVSIEADAISAAAEEKLKKHKIPYKLVAAKE